MLLDAETLELAPGVERLLGPDGVKTELFSCLVETNTPVCESAVEAHAELVRLRAVVLAAAANAGLVVAAAGSHPFSRAEDQEIVPEPRYLKLLEELGPGLRRQLVCGLHVHVGMESFDACLRTLAAIVPWLPAVLALSLNSPYMQRCGDGCVLVSGCTAGRATARARNRRRSSRRRNGSHTSRRPARTTHAAGGMPARTRASARSKFGSPTSRRQSAARPRSRRSCRRSASPRRRPIRWIGTRTWHSELQRHTATRPTGELLELVEPAARELGSWELVQGLTRPDRGGAPARGGPPRRSRGSGRRPGGAELSLASGSRWRPSPTRSR